ncbi:hypothetical protein N2152v2_010616 [Parachlorella kessleri]
MRTFLAFVCLLATVILVPGARAKNATATLTGANQVPPLTTTASGTWEAEETEGGLGKWTLTIKNANEVIMAHIHQGSAGQNGPVVLQLVPENATQPKLTTPASGPMLEYTGDITTGNLTGPLASKKVADLIALMKKNDTYVNVHTVAHPDGEIRGQIVY